MPREHVRRGSALKGWKTTTNQSDFHILAGPEMGSNPSSSNVGRSPAVIAGGGGCGVDASTLIVADQTNDGLVPSMVTRVCGSALLAAIPRSAADVFLRPELNGPRALVTFSLRNRRAGRILAGGIIRFSALHDVAGWRREATNASFDGRLTT